MPREFEDFHLNPSYAICNVPPTVMFKAKIFKPPRLCAVFTIEGACVQTCSNLTSFYKLLSMVKTLRAKISSTKIAGI
jgi:hypothetical protein